jgi:hypothetical protein
MPNVQNTVQVAAQRAGESYLDSYELGDPEAIPRPGALFLDGWPGISSRDRYERKGVKSCAVRPSGLALFNGELDVKPTRMRRPRQV